MEQQLEALILRLNSMEEQNKKKIEELERKVEEKEAGMKEWEVAGETLSEGLRFLTEACSRGMDKKVKIVLIREKSSILVKMWKALTPLVRTVAILEEDAEGLDVETIKLTRTAKRVHPRGNQE